MGREDIGQPGETVRRANLSAIVRELHARGPLSRSELGARTGLTRSAIRSLIGELAARRHGRFTGGPRGSAGVDAPLLGGAELAFEPILADPAGWLEPRPALPELASA